MGEPHPSPEHHPLWLSKAILELHSKHLLLLPLPPYTQAFGNSIPGSTSSHRLPHRPSAAHFGPEQPGPSPVTLGATSTLLPHSDVTCCSNPGGQEPSPVSSGPPRAQSTGLATEETFRKCLLRNEARP